MDSKITETADGISKILQYGLAGFAVMFAILTVLVLWLILRGSLTSNRLVLAKFFTKALFMFFLLTLVFIILEKLLPSIATWVEKNPAVEASLRVQPNRKDFISLAIVEYNSDDEIYVKEHFLDQDGVEISRHSPIKLTIENDSKIVLDLFELLERHDKLLADAKKGQFSTLTSGLPAGTSGGDIDFQ